MEIEDYLQALKECKDVLIRHPSQNQKEGMPNLTLEYGIYDNFPVFFNTKYEKLVRDLQESGKFAQSGTLGLEGTYLRHTETGNEMQVYRPQIKKDLLMWASTGGMRWVVGQNIEPEKVEHGERQLRDYNGLIVLHDQGGELLVRTRSMVHQITDLAIFLREKSIPFCFSRSIGWAHQNDLSKLVYYQPKIR